MRIHTISRRRFLQTTGSCLLPLALPACGRQAKTPGHAYIDKLSATLRSIGAKEAVSIRDMADMLANSVIAKKRCFLYSGHPAIDAFLDDPANGLPPLFIALRSKQMAEAVAAGDSVLTCTTGDIPAICRNNGAHIAWISSPFTADGYGSGDLERLINKNTVSEFCDITVNSHLPADDGLVGSGGYPFDYPFAVLSGFAPVMLAVISAVAGEAYARSGGIGLTGAKEPSAALEFLEILRERISTAAGRMGTIRDAAALVTTTVRSEKRVLVSGRSAFYEADILSASGMPLFLEYISPAKIRSGGLTPDDCLIYCASSSNAPGDMVTLGAAKKWTNRIVTVSPHDATGGYRLHEEAKAAIDNLSHDADGVIAFDSGSVHFLKSAQILNAALLRALAGESLLMLSAGERLPVMRMGSHLAGHEQYNLDAERSFMQNGY